MPLPYEIPGIPEYKLIPPDDFMMSRNSRRYFLLMAAKNKGKWIQPLVSETEEKAKEEAKKAKRALQEDPLTLFISFFEEGWGRWPDINDCIILYQLDPVEGEEFHVFTGEGVKLYVGSDREEAIAEAENYKPGGLKV